MECARWADEYTMQGRPGLQSNVSLHVRYLLIDAGDELSLAAATYSGCIRSPARSLLCLKPEEQVLLSPGATLRLRSRRPLLKGKLGLDSQKMSGALSGKAQWIDIAIAELG